MERDVAVYSHRATRQSQNALQKKTPVTQNMSPKAASSVRILSLVGSVLLGSLLVWLFWFSSFSWWLCFWLEGWSCINGGWSLESTASCPKPKSKSSFILFYSWSWSWCVFHVSQSQLKFFLHSTPQKGPNNQQNDRPQPRVRFFDLWVFFLCDKWPHTCKTWVGFNWKHEETSSTIKRIMNHAPSCLHEQ